MLNDILPIEAKVKYINRRIKDLSDCKIAFAKYDFTKLIYIGHQIKGNAQTFGFKKLGLIAADLEKHALDKNLIEIENSINQEFYNKTLMFKELQNGGIRTIKIISF